MIFRPPRLESEELEVIQFIEQLKKEWAYQIQPKRWFGALRRNTAARAIRGSIGIEGFNVSIEDAVAALSEHEIEDPDERNRSALVSFRRAMTLALQKAGDPYFNYSSDFLNALHFIIVDYDMKHHPGLWRTGPVYVHDEKAGAIVYEAPEPDQVPALMGELVVSLQEDCGSHPLIRAAMAHLNLVMVHPYVDGNGRMARCLQTLVLMREWNNQNPHFVSIEEYLGRNTKEYYDVLTEVGRGTWKPMNDTRPWVRSMLTAHYRQAVTLKSRANYYQKVFELAETMLRKADLPERATVALGEAMVGFQIRNASYRSLADVSIGTASRDLASLVEAGLLDAVGERRGRYYTVSERAVTESRKIERPGKSPDPFQLLLETPSGQSKLPGMGGNALESGVVP